MDLRRVTALQVELPGGLLAVGGVDHEARGVLLDGGDQALDQPRDMPEQALACSLPDTEIDECLLAGDIQALRHLPQMDREDRGDPRRGDRETEIGSGQRLAGEIAQSVAELHPEVHARHLIHHLQHGPDHLPRLLGQ